MKKIFLLITLGLTIHAHSQLIVDPPSPKPANNLSSIQQKEKAATSIPSLTSNPSSPNTIFLDFDGESIRNTSWNWDNSAIVALDAGLTETQIREVFNRVAEDYLPFNVTVTTDSTIYNHTQQGRRIRALITRSSEWYGTAAGGVSYVGSFKWNDNSPCWIFSNLHYYNTKNISEATSHEIGHSLGLYHQADWSDDCILRSEYNRGKGIGEISWGPIMGSGYNVNLTTWTKGSDQYACNRIQDDFLIIASMLGLKGREGRRELPLTSLEVKETGLIIDRDDIDTFDIELRGETKLNLLIAAPIAGISNLDIKVKLISKETVREYNPQDSISVHINETVPKGKYMLTVEGVGNQYMSDYGSIGDYEIRGSVFTISSLPLVKFILNGKAKYGTHTLSWSYETDENVKSITIQSSIDGRVWKDASIVSLTQSSYSLTATQDSYYRIKASTNIQTYYSNTIMLKAMNDNIKVTSTYIQSDRSFTYEVFDPAGRLMIKGKGQAGRTDLHIGARGLYFVVIAGESYRVLVQ